MALETLKHYKQINGHQIMRETERPMTDQGEVDWPAYDELRKQRPIAIDDSKNMISFRIQNGPIKEVGKNGCQVDELISAALLMIKGLNQRFPDDCNVKAMTALYEAQTWLQQCKNLRSARGVEGTSQR